MFKNIDFTPGKIAYLEFNIDKTIPLHKQDDYLTEDILQVFYPNNLLIDVGWYSSQFIVNIIKKCDWDNPIVKIKCKTLEELEESIKKCISIVREMIEKEDKKNINNITLFKNIDFTPGKILYFDFYFNPQLSFEDNTKFWSKDLIQVDYPHGFNLHVGWYENQFIVDLVEGFQWNNPIVIKKCKTLENLEKLLKECIYIVREKI